MGKIDDLIALQNAIIGNDKELDKMLELNGIVSKYGFYELKDKFLENLIFNENIEYVGENPSEYFRKLIQLYGEEKLAHYSSYIPYFTENDVDNIYYDYYDEEQLDSDYEYDRDHDEIELWIMHSHTKEDEKDYDFEEYETNDNDTGKTLYLHTLHNFVAGKEDELIGVASTRSLKNALLVSKLITVQQACHGVYPAIREYAEKSDKYGEISSYTDEYGCIDEETALLNLDNRRNAHTR